jgi:hypothetical protein
MEEKVRTSRFTVYTVHTMGFVSAGWMDAGCPFASRHFAWLLQFYHSQLVETASTRHWEGIKND